MDGANVWDPALVQQLIALSSAPDQQQALQQRIQFGREDSQTPMPQGMRVGGTYVASSPLEHLAAALKQGVGLAQQRNAQGGLDESIQQQTQGRQAYGDMLGRLLSMQGQ